MPRSRASGCAFWRVWAAAHGLRPAEPAPTRAQLRDARVSPMQPASAKLFRRAPEQPARAPTRAISWHQSSRLRAMSTVLTRRDGAVLTITLNRPDAYNAFTRELHTEFHQALSDAAADPGVRAVVVTGAG